MVFDSELAIGMPPPEK